MTKSVDFSENHGTVGTPSIGWKPYLSLPYRKSCHPRNEGYAGRGLPPGGADDFRVDYRFIIIQCPVGITVHAYSIAHSFFIATIPSEISEQISYIIFFGKGIFARNIPEVQTTTITLPPKASGKWFFIRTIIIIFILNHFNL